MKILIIGEFSAFAKHLKNGFRILGNDVTVVQNGDGWKGLANSEDIMIRTCKEVSLFGLRIRGLNRITAPFARRDLQKQLRKRCPKPDVMIVINYTFLSSNCFQSGVPISFIENCIKNGSKLIMSVCGIDPANYYRNPEMFKAMGVKRNRENMRHLFLINNSDVVIPTCYGYYDAIYNYCIEKGFKYSHIRHSIPLPITVDSNCNIDPCENRKIVIFHGIIRPRSKGTPFIKKAMERIHEDYPDRVECFCEGGLPYNEYVKLFDRVDILIDQTYGNGWGMNAAIGAMKGKCVLTCCGKENEADMGIENIPFVQIMPNHEQIYNVLKDLILHPQIIDDIKRRSREFVEKYCECSIVANKYIQTLFLK